MGHAPGGPEMPRERQAPLRRTGQRRRRQRCLGRSVLASALAVTFILSLEWRSEADAHPASLPFIGGTYADTDSPVEDDYFREDDGSVDRSWQATIERIAEAARAWGGETAAAVAVTALEAVFLLTCLPGYGVIEYTAGALFGLQLATVVTFVAKLVAAVLAYLLIATMRESKAGQYVQRQITKATNSGGSGIAGRIQAGIHRDSARFIFVLRLSPLPAWLPNYALPLAGVPFPTYFACSLFGMVVPSIINVYTGAVGAKVFSMLKAGDLRNVNLLEVLPVAFPLLSSMILVRLLSSYALADEQGRAANGTTHANP